MLTGVQEPPLLGSDAIPVLLALILLVLTLQLLLALWRIFGPDMAVFTGREALDPVQRLVRHNEAVTQFLQSPTHGEVIVRTALVEASLAAEIDQTMERLGELSADDLRARYADFDYPVTDRAIDWIRRNFNARNAGAVGMKLFEKVLGLTNKMMGLPG